MPTFSEMAGRWPWWVAGVSTLGLLNLFISFLICDILQQNFFMLGSAWAGFFTYVLVVATSDYDSLGDVRTAHFVLAATLVVLTALYTGLGAYSSKVFGL